MFTAADAEWMRLALAEAERAINHATPNPRVGAVLVRDGKLLGRGHTQPPGGPHAEVMALRDARARGAEVAGATLYVTLEPCNHFGRTPPCVDALIEARVARVIAALEDPNPLVSGRGFARLRESGIEVRVGLLAAEATELNLGFIKRMTLGLPWVRVKMAISLDGRTGLADGRSQWITGEEARLDGHRFRARACAIATGVGTVRHDDPALTVRGLDFGGALRQPRRIVFDHVGNMPPNARVLDAETGGATLILADKTPPGLPAHVRTVHCPDGRGKIDLLAAFRWMASEGINEVHIEAGARLTGPMIEAGLVDELLVYVGPKLLGLEAREMFTLASPRSLEAARTFDLHDVARFGDDVRLIYRTP
ncbi:MAG: bifunctional diaminohydroxyphosphoribosylaminopyrimidine deaminase/5-amino-6-(5-phosphoribosylamino)uracil reductase RibD [Casimicrobiaceae bacterium]|nr:bifunctional diaminohydroxyphosphoribosylaminopyrimidine deaminase/5-amino-6-(5-phosphoribosylamino)uracil reductase RibD [Casimicrobiaceae bacterium]MCX8099169.1 bifunctional diaminohydroxyphosphoribosylaminopyrimidine deaminase/5-amino-6-(5-phosphoribosylamino)uracil reductase RibD [Casimicrobiaceae bacterium]MDW8312608.1 bifunctional diaminohydroxyphosphoribosylaminopyrimidine deaminase/5-amino-6-(5-phosphoribosylamino)uracil reductase RibD [Burkholderiales bacterium]